MGNIISSFLSTETLGSVFSFFAGEARYVWGLKENLDALQAELGKLKQTEGDLLNDVELAEQQPRTRRTDLVIGWLDRVDQIETKVMELQQDRDREIDRLCLGGFCSKHLISTYDFGKRVQKLKEVVDALIDERGKIKDVSKMVPEAAAVALPIDQRMIVGQESIFEQVWRFVEDEQVGVIGMYGTGGVGKTTLLKRVNNNFLSVQHQFDVVIWSVVSREPNLEKIQADIGKRIGFSAESWQKKSFEDKALDISNILSRKKFVLLLDDIWKPVDLSALGVPLQSLNTASKIVFTTRSYAVCGQMQAPIKLNVSILEHGEAWKLFQEVVGRDVLGRHRDIPKLAETMARECGGLPLALKTVGQAMASVSKPEEWKRQIEILSESASKFSDMEEKVLSRLKFSYDSFPNNKLRYCLLYCCLFPEDYEIRKTDLIEYWISEGFLDYFDDGYIAIGDLHRACLIEEDDDYVKLHDVIRDMALWIACKLEAGENFLVHAGVQLTEAPQIEKWEGVKRISLMDNRIKSLKKVPTCPRLQTLFLDGNGMKKIIDGFFQFMPSLRVLSLRGNLKLTELPSEISNLVLLEHLDLSHTRIRVLPKEMKALVNLRYLNLEWIMNMHRIPMKLISSFSKLQVLKMLNCCYHYPPKMEEGNVLCEDVESLMKELQCLEHLNHISLSLYSLRAVQNFVKYPKLMDIAQFLSIIDCETLPVNVLLDLTYMMKKLKFLVINNSNLEEWKINSAREAQKVLQSGFCSLHTVNINTCSGVKDLTWLAFVQNLKGLAIGGGCDDMEEIITVEKLSEVSEIMEVRNIFAQLEFLRLDGLKSLKSVYRNPLPFPQLKDIRVIRCPKLKKLPLNSSSVKERQVVIKGEKKWWAELQWEDQVTQNIFSTCFIPYRY